MYQAKTLKSYNQARRNFLPCFPSPYSHQPLLLFSNVPDQMLSNEQRQHRQSGRYLLPFSYEILNQEQHSFMNFIYRYLYEHLNERFHVDLSILDYNLTRLDETMTIMCMQHDQQYWTDEQRKYREDRSIQFDFAQIALALEIFLQVDVDLFYIKTCNYNGAQPRQVNSNEFEGIFCRLLPEARYCFQPCQQIDCRSCSILLNNETYHSHEFLNGYRTILNCPAVSIINLLKLIYLSLSIYR